MVLILIKLIAAAEQAPSAGAQYLRQLSISVSNAARPVGICSINVSINRIEVTN